MMKKWIDSVIDDLVLKIGLEHLDTYTLVFPMQRAGLFVQHYIKSLVKARHEQGMNTPIILPHTITIDDLVDSLSELRNEEEIVSVCRLYEAYRHYVVSNPMPLEVFYGWGLQLMTDFSNIEMATSSPENVIKTMADAALLETLVLDDETREHLMELLGKKGEEHSIQRYFSELWEVLPHIYRTFTEQQRESGVGTRGARYRWVIEHWNQVNSPLKQRTFVFIGFNYLSGAERELMDCVCAHTTTYCYWDMDKNFTLDSEIYKFMRDDVAHFNHQSIVLNETARNVDMSVVCCQSNTAQAQYVHSWLKQHHHAGELTAIVLADESLLQSVIYALPGDLNVNVTKGYALSQTPIYAQLIDLLNRDYGTLTLETIMAQIVDNLANSNQLTSQTTIQHEWQQILSDEAYYQTQAVIRELRVLMTSNDIVARHLTSFPLIRTLLRRKLEKVAIPFHGEPITDIQIIGVLETRLLDFDHVLILNVEEGVVPNMSVDHSFIPYDLRKAYNMQTRDEEAKIYAYNFFRLLRRPHDVTFTFSEASTEMGKKAMSRFLMQLLSSSSYTLKRYRLSEVASRTEINPLGEHEDSLLMPLEQMPKHLSPSAISDYIECPREFYFKHIRKIAEPQQDSVLLSAQDFGTIVHRALQLCYTKQLEPRTALQRAYSEGNYAIEEHEAENFVILRMVKFVLEQDKEQTSIHSLGCEVPVRWNIPDDYCTILGTIDRMDIVEKDGRSFVRLLDYKTGALDENKLSYNKMDELFVDPDKRYVLQMFLYSLIVEHNREYCQNSNLPIVPQLLFLRNRAAYQPIEEYNKHTAKEFENLLLKKVHAILSDTSFPMTDEARCASSFCPFHTLCNREKK